MSFTHNCGRLLGAHILHEPRGLNIVELKPFGPMKSAPMQLIYSYFKQSNNVNISFILFILFYILFHLYLVILYMFTSPEGICAKPKFCLGGNMGEGKARARGQLPPLPPLWSRPCIMYVFRFCAITFLQQELPQGNFVCVYTYI